MAVTRMNRPRFGSPFCHLHHSLWSDEIRSLLSDCSLSYDEYGFVVDRSQCDTGPQSSDQTPAEDGAEESQYREVKQKWINYLEEEYKKLAPSSCLDLSQFDADIERVPSTPPFTLSTKLMICEVSSKPRSPSGSRKLYSIGSSSR